MHELQLMRQVVNRLEKLCQEHPGSQLATIRIEISSHSHLASHTTEELQTTFQLAAEGTPAQTGTLEIQTIPVHGTCCSCGTTIIRRPETFGCSHCSSPKVQWEDGPELTLREVDIQEGPS